MTSIEWRPEFATGIADVDHEHRVLIDWINRALVMRDGREDTNVGGVLGEIFAKISAHFALEERVMLSRDYDQLGEHKADHERLLDEIREIMDDHEAGLAGERFAARLTDWFSVHFRTHDARFHSAMPAA